MPFDYLGVKITGRGNDGSDHRRERIADIRDVDVQASIFSLSSLKNVTRNKKPINNTKMDSLKCRQTTREFWSSGSIARWIQSCQSASESEIRALFSYSHCGDLLLRLNTHRAGHSQSRQRSDARASGDIVLKRQIVVVSIQLLFQSRVTQLCQSKRQECFDVLNKEGH